MVSLNRNLEAFRHKSAPALWMLGWASGKWSLWVHT